jgi:hypothetical protein
MNKNQKTKAGSMKESAKTLKEKIIVKSDKKNDQKNQFARNLKKS